MEEWYNVLKVAYKKYLIHGARSNEKLKPIHSWIGNKILKKLNGDNFKVVFIDSDNSSEYLVEGKYYPKREDIVVLYENKPIFVISFKFVTSNYKQNVNNYFENLIGECANIRTANIGFGHILVLRDKIPYFKKSREISKVEIPNDKDLKKYFKLYDDRTSMLHAPNLFFVDIISITPFLEQEQNYIPGNVTDNDLRNKNIEVKDGINFLRLSNEIKERIKETNILDFINQTVKFCKELAKNQK